MFSSVILAASAIATTIPVGSAGTPNKNEVFINNLTVNGSGCPAGSVASAISEDLSSFTLLFSNFVATSGPDVSIPESRRNCVINIDLRYPQGWSYSVATVDYRGYMAVPEGVTAIQRSAYYFSGQVGQAVTESRWNGPNYDDYLVRNEIGISKLVWSRCGTVERGNINTQVRLQGDLTQSAQITVDSIDGTVKQIYGLQWRKC
jgi:hypothetical protein